MLSIRQTLVLMSLALSFTLLGCQPEEKITRTVRPRLNDMNRLLAAIVLPDKNQKDQKTWFFKMVGPESAMERLAGPFNEFVRSIRFPMPDNPTWTLPPDWLEDKGKESKLRFTTIFTDAKHKGPELTVSALQGEDAASVPMNVRRWRLQLGLKDVLGSSDLEDFYRFDKAGDRTVIVVDMLGPRAGGNVAPLELPAAAKLPFTFQAPQGWQEIPATNKLYILSLVASEKDRRASINVSVFAGAGGGLEANVNRWRAQVGLDALTPAQVRELPELPIGTAKGKLVDVSGPNAPPENNRIMGAILIRDNDSLFFKMMGPSEFVGSQRPNFESFLKSIHFGG